MSALINYTIDLDVNGFEESPDDLIKFLEEYKPLFGDLLTYKQSNLNPAFFNISVPSDTNFFMLGILWAKWRMINEVCNSDDSPDWLEELADD